MATDQPSLLQTRHPDDFYATPRWPTVAILDALDVRGAVTRAATLGGILEPTCGDGAILDVLAERLDQGRLQGWEIDPGRTAEAARRGHRVICRDVLEVAAVELFGVRWVFGNPPFSIAQEIIEALLAAMQDGARLTFLLRLAFLASKRRAPLYTRTSGFEALHVLPRRPSFTPDGGTDKYDYGWFTWRKGFTGAARIFRLEDPR